MLMRWFLERRAVATLSEQLDMLRALDKQVPECHAERYGHKPMERAKPRTIKQWQKLHGRTA